MIAPVALLRFATLGHVDDGKSTLIGRLLYDAKALFQDQVEALQQNFDLAQITDGLRAEREQGITIDVAYRYFATPKRRFMIADCPGHGEYLCNALTGMSQCEVALLLVDVRAGLQPQTRRHAQLAALMGMDVVVCVNKMDLVGFSEERFIEVREQIETSLSTLAFSSLHILPMSALEGAMVAHRGQLSWYQGPPLLRLLETLHPGSEPARPARMFVQTVLEQRDGISYAGTVDSGHFEVGQKVLVLPKGGSAIIETLEDASGPRTWVCEGEPVVLRMKGDSSLSRGNLLAEVRHPPTLSRTAESELVWMQKEPLRSGLRSLLQVASQQVPVMVSSVSKVRDLENFEMRAAKQLSENDIGTVHLEADTNFVFDVGSGRPMSSQRFALIDPSTKQTQAIGWFGV